MNVTVISKSKRGAMITIVHDGISETRHCRTLTDGFQGFMLDADKTRLLAMEMLSRQTSVALRTGGVISEPYIANLFCVYQKGDTSAKYAAMVMAETMRARAIFGRQKDEVARLHAEQEARRAKEQARKKAG